MLCPQKCLGVCAVSLNFSPTWGCLGSVFLSCLCPWVCWLHCTEPSGLYWKLVGLSAKDSLVSRINWLWLKPQWVVQGPIDKVLSLLIVFLLYHSWLTPWHTDAKKKPGTPIWFFSTYWDVLGLYTYQWGEHLHLSRCNHSSGWLFFLSIPSKSIPINTYLDNYNSL